MMIFLHPTSSSMQIALLFCVLLKMLVGIACGQESDQCPTLMEQCNSPALSNHVIREIATGRGKTTLLCRSNTFPNNAFQWHFTKTTFSEGHPLMIDGAKYAVNGFRGQLLTVTSITEHDEGIYFCQDGTSDPVLGGCLYVYSPAQFKECPGQKIPELGCSTTEELQATTRDITVGFDVSLTHENVPGSCFNQTILTVVFRKDGSDLDIRCSNESCRKSGTNAQRFQVVRKTNGHFDITVTLSNATKNDSGMYRLKANLQHPTGSYITAIYKTFSLRVTEVHFEMEGQEYGNNSVVNVHSIGEGTKALLCVTDKQDCCNASSSNRAETFGEFFFPNGTRVPTDEKRHGLYRHQGERHISLNRREGVKFPAGRYSCELLDGGGVIQEVFIYLSGDYK